MYSFLWSHKNALYYFFTYAVVLTETYMCYNWWSYLFNSLSCVAILRPAGQFVRERMSWLATWNQQRQYLTHYSVKLCVIRERNSFREVSRRKSRFFSAAWTVFVPAPLYLQNALPLFTHTAFIISLHLNLNVLLNISAQMQPEAIFVCVCVCPCVCACVRTSVKWSNAERGRLLVFFVVWAYSHSRRRAGKYELTANTVDEPWQRNEFLHLSHLQTRVSNSSEGLRIICFIEDKVDLKNLTLVL